MFTQKTATGFVENKMSLTFLMLTISWSWRRYPLSKRRDIFRLPVTQHSLPDGQIPQVCVLPVPVDICDSTEWLHSFIQRCKHPTRCNKFRLLIFINQLYMFRATNSPILRSTFWLYIQLLVQCADIATGRPAAVSVLLRMGEFVARNM